jgi:hypothetical protein
MCEWCISYERVKEDLLCGAVFSGVLYILCKGQEFGPLVLLSVTVKSQILFEGLVSML